MSHPSSIFDAPVYPTTSYQFLAVSRSGILPWLSASASATHARTSTIPIKDVQYSFVNPEDSSISRLPVLSIGMNSFVYVVERDGGLVSAQGICRRTGTARIQR